MKNCHKSVYGWFIGKSGSLKTALYFCLFVKGKKKKKRICCTAKNIIWENFEAYMEDRMSTLLRTSCCLLHRAHF